MQISRNFLENSSEGNPPKKDTRPNKNSLHKQFVQTLSACCMLILKGKFPFRFFLRNFFIWVFVFWGVLLFHEKKKKVFLSRRSEFQAIMFLVIWCQRVESHFGPEIPQKSGVSRVPPAEEVHLDLAINEISYLSANCLLLVCLLSLTCLLLVC